MAAMAITLGYALVEFFGGLWSGSLALVSDAGHMFTDSLALTLAAAAGWLAQRPPGGRHSYGWARAEVLAAMLNGLLMLCIVVFVVVEAVQRLLDPRPVSGEGVMLIAFFGLLVNGTSAFLLSGGEHTLNTRAALIHVMSDFLGSLAAITAGAVVYFTGWLPIDAILSLSIAALILVTSLKLLRDALHVLMEGVPGPYELDEIGHALAKIEGVRSVHDLHVWSIASNQIALSAHLRIKNLPDWPVTLAAARDCMRDRFGIDHVTLQPEIEQPQAAATAVVRLWRDRAH